MQILMSAQWRIQDWLITVTVMQTVIILLAVSLAHAAVDTLEMEQIAQVCTVLYICRKNYDIDEYTIVTDINECAEGVDDCHRESNATCEDTDGDFRCTCRNGFIGNGTFCSSTSTGGLYH